MSAFKFKNWAIDHDDHMTTDHSGLGLLWAEGSDCKSLLSTLPLNLSLEQGQVLWLWLHLGDEMQGQLSVGQLSGKKQHGQASLVVYSLL